jgi:glycosyltransferase involved in cell wall biosynthesis
MRILLVGDYPRDARLGSTKVLLKLQEEFRGLGHACDVLLADDIGLTRAGVHIRRAVAPVAALAAVRRAFRERGCYDVVDVASAESLWLGALRRIGMLERTTVVARSNGLEHLDYRRMLDDADHGLLSKPWTRRLLYPAIRLSQVAAAARPADRLIVLNEVDREFAVRRGWKQRDEIDVVPHGISTAFLASAPPSHAPRGAGLLFCGSWADVKGVSYLARAFSAVVAAGAPVNLTVVGGGVSEETIRAAFAPRAQAFVSVRPRVSEDEVMAAYRAHDVLVAPSTYEGFGMVVAEAMSQRLPVIATPVGCARTLVADGRSGWVVPPRDAHALAAAIQRSLSNAEVRRRVGDAAHDAVRGLTWTATALATLVAYEKAGARNGHA